MKRTTDIVLRVLAISRLDGGGLEALAIADRAGCHLRLGCLADTKQWFVRMAAVVLLTDAQFTSGWQEKTPDFEATLQNTTKIQENSRKLAIFVKSRSLNTF